LTQGRYLTGEDYERLVTVFPGASTNPFSPHPSNPLTPPTGTNLNGVKIKTSRFRVEQRNMYEELGWQLPEGGAGSKRKKAADGTAEPETPTKSPAKKPRAKKGSKAAKAKESEGSDEGEKVKEENVEAGRVKEENVEDEI